MNAQILSPSPCWAKHRWLFLKWCGNTSIIDSAPHSSSRLHITCLTCKELCARFFFLSHTFINCRSFAKLCCLSYLPIQTQQPQKSPTNHSVNHVLPMHCQLVKRTAACGLRVGHGGRQFPLAPQSQCNLTWKNVWIADTLASVEPGIVCASAFSFGRGTVWTEEKGKEASESRDKLWLSRVKGQRWHLFGAAARVFKVYVWLVVLCQTGVQLAGIHKHSFCFWVGHSSGLWLSAYHKLALHSKIIYFHQWWLL